MPKLLHSSSMKTRTARERVARIMDEIRGVVAQYDVTQWELEFMRSIEERHALSPRQEEILTDIETKVFG
jgi:hypothetical protein